MIAQILQVIGIIAIIWLTLFILSNVIVNIVNLFSKESDIIGIVRETNIYSTEATEWYITPAISFYFEFGKKSYPTFKLTWLKWIFFLSYHFKTEQEEELEHAARIEMLKDDNNK